MGIQQYKPTSAGRRAGSVSDFRECTNPKVNAPEKSLLKPRQETRRPQQSRHCDHPIPRRRSQADVPPHRL